MSTTLKSDDINITAIVNGKDRYFFFYRESQRREVLRKFGEFASNPELNFSWYACARLSQMVRQDAKYFSRLVRQNAKRAANRMESQ